MPAAALGDQLASCGVASAAVYFPGFHHSVDNDLLWGEGWTEWVNLRGEVNDTVASTAVRHPRRGYYDIWDGGAATLRAQAAEAKSAGVRAFMFYHCANARIALLPACIFVLHVCWHNPALTRSSVLELMADWFAHGRTALSRPLEDALLGGHAAAAAAAAAAANANANRNPKASSGRHGGRASGGSRKSNAAAADPPSIGLPFFFSWANEPWERRRIMAGAFKGDSTAGGGTAAPRVALIKQDYGGRADWEAHFEWMLRFFRHPEYVRVGGAPLLVIYDATDFGAERLQPGQTATVQELRSCGNSSNGGDAGVAIGSGSYASSSNSDGASSCGGRPTPLGCAAAEQYLQWYPQLSKFLTLETAYAYHTVQGERLGFAWPRSNPCVSTRSQSPRLLPQMLATWQRLARARGLANGLHVLFTMNHQPNSAPSFSKHFLSGRGKVAGENVGVQGMVQFLPTSMVALPFMTRGWPWGANGNFYWGLFRECYREEMGMPASTTNVTSFSPPRGWKMTCECLLRHVGSEEVERRYSDAMRTSNRGEMPLTFVRGAFASWSNYPRVKNRGAAYCRNPTAASFKGLLQKQLSRALDDAGGAAACDETARNATASAAAAWRHLVLVNSWNEWGEQAAIEPSIQDGEALLDAHREAVRSVTAKLKR